MYLKIVKPTECLPILLCTIFQDVTGSDSDRAGFFLESSNWDLDVAVGSFFESGGEMAMDQAAPPAQPAGNDHDL